MPLREILLLGNPQLRVKSTEVKQFNDEYEANLEDLKDTLLYLQKTRKIGRAIAAPQIGWRKNVIVFNLPDRSFVMVNPKILSKSREIIEVWDSCFCFDIAFFIKIERFKEIKVKYLNKEGTTKVETFGDDFSELIQHEIDHLNGILATDHLKNPKQIVMRHEWEQRFK
ncbi:MAG: peptide deformylase [Candidatus Lokiarchaeota archaeon]|nr:peptide deformylase [Candidatus Lokiarchaeota archaeon]